MSEKEWYSIWFESTYYYILYDNRNEHEASYFVDNVCQALQITEGKSVIDLACGKGRFSYPLYQKGLKVYGLDIAQHSIDQAQQQYSDTRIQFIQHDMLRPFPVVDVDYVFNFYTSFGYFGKDKMEIALENIYNALGKEGILLIDYFNAAYIKKHLIEKEHIQKGAIEFQISRTVVGEYIVKDILVKDASTSSTHHFEERVYDMDLPAFVALLEKSNFSIINVFGDYRMQDYDIEQSKRLILLAKKK